MLIMRFLIVAAVLWIGETAAQTTISPNPLAGLPSAPGATIASINAMGDNSWLNLGRPAGDPVYGNARGCSWGTRSMVLAPELRGAFHTGEGWHAGVKSDGFGQDDYWFYDINGHRWICLYPGTDIPHFNQMATDGVISVDSLGRAVDTTGQPIPGHLLIHAWGHLTYDTHRKKFTINSGSPFGRYFMPGLPTIDPGLTLLESQGLNKAGFNFAPWAYNTQTGRFERELAANARISAGGYSQFLYVPTLRQFANIGGEGVVYFDPATGLSRKVTLTGVVPGGYEYGGCYDSRRDRFYLGDAATHFFSYDVQTETGANISAPQVSPFLGTCVGVMSPGGSLDYDSINDVVLGFDWGLRTILLYDPSTSTWVDAFPFDPSFVPGGTNRAFYDPELGVHFIFKAGDSGDDGIMWVYKFRTKAIVEKEKTLQSVTLIADDAAVEKYLWTQLRIVQTYQSLPTDTTGSFLGSVLTNLTPAVVSVSSAGLLRALDTGTARVVLEKRGLKDTLILPVVASSAITDSIVIKPDTVRFLAGDSFQLVSTGYFHKDTKAFTRALDTVALWSSAQEGVVTVADGNLKGVAAGGPAEITGSFDGHSARVYVVVWPRPDYIRRINFQCSATPWKYGWVAANDEVYSASRGYGWTTQGDCRDDRAGSNFLLKSFSSSTGGFRLDAPDGRYIIKTGMGDNVYGVNSANSVLFNGDTVNAKPPGTANGVNVDTIEISGGSGALFTVSGPINYLVIISDQGIDINLVADDGGLADNETIGGSGVEKAALEKAVFGISAEPNPFNSATVITISDPDFAGGTLDVYSIVGKRVFRCEPGSRAQNRLVRVRFDGASLGSGVYFAVYRHGATKMKRPLMLIK